MVGPGGRGSVAASGLTAREVPLLLVTFGKAIGTYGAAICGPTDVIDALVETARPFGLTTALPPALAAATRRSLSLIKNEPWRRFKLAALIARFRRGARQLGLPVLDSSTPIQPLLVHGNVEALRAAQALQARGLLISAIRPPTVPEGRARLRVTLSSAHSESEVDQLLDALGGVLKDHLTPPRLPKSLTR